MTVCRPATFTIALANIENRDAVLANVQPLGRVLLLNECKPQRERIKQWPDWGSRFADTNAVAWQRHGVEHVQSWRREILRENGRRWQDSHAIATWLRIDEADSLVVATHFPSKAFTTMPWRREGWYEARRNLLDFVDDIDRDNPELAGAPTIIGGDFNRRRADWSLGDFQRTVGLVTYGRDGHYDQIFTRGLVAVAEPRARRLGSPHRTVTATFTIHATQQDAA